MFSRSQRSGPAEIFDYDTIPKRFWCGNWFFKGTRDVIPDGHDCCFNHYIGLPQREMIKDQGKVRHPFYDYQEEVLREIKRDKKRCYAIIKSPKLGFTEMWIRFCLHRCLIDPSWDGGQAMIVNGIRQGESNEIIRRMKVLLEKSPHPIPIDPEYNRMSYFKVRGTQIFGLPAGNVEALRSKENARFVFIDESAFFKMMENDKRVKDAAEHYLGSLHYYLVMVTTAGENATGFFHDIIHDQNPKYNIFKFTNPDLYGLKPHPDSGTHMYIPEVIEIERNDSSFRRNYLGEWGAGDDTIFDQRVIDEISERKYRILNPGMYDSVLGVDPAYGRGVSKTGSRFGLLGMYRRNGILYTSYERELHQISESEGRAAILHAMKAGYQKVAVDGAWPGLIKDLKRAGLTVKTVNVAVAQSGVEAVQVLGDEEAKYEEGMKMIDVFEGVVSNKRLRIHPDHKVLIRQMRAIQRNERGLPNKKITRFDVGDAACMAAYCLATSDMGRGIS